MKTKTMKTIQLWMLVLALTISCSTVLTSCSKDDDNKNEGQQTEQEFQEELDQAMAWAQVYGPTTQSLAEAVAARHNVIHTESGVEPGLSHYYYEIIRADSTSEATREYYKS